MRMRRACILVLRIVNICSTEARMSARTCLHVHTHWRAGRAGVETHVPPRCTRVGTPGKKRAHVGLFARAVAARMCTRALILCVRMPVYACGHEWESIRKCARHGGHVSAHVRRWCECVCALFISYTAICVRARVCMHRLVAWQCGMWACRCIYACTCACV